MNNAQAYLVAYTESGRMEYRTYNYEEVYKFKKICASNNIPHSVHFRKPPEDTKAYIRNPWTIIKSFFTK